VSPRARAFTLAGLAAAGFAAAVVGITAATANHPPKPKALCSATTEQQLGTVASLRAAAAKQPRSAFAHLRLGLALACAGDAEAAVAEWRAAKRVEPDTPAAVRAADLLHPDSPRGLPQFQPSFAHPATAAERLLVKGVRFEAAGRPLSARRTFAAAARLAPGDPDAQVAAAVGLYDKDDPTPAFARLGPLSRRFPEAQTVRFHLGILLIWTNRFTEARRQLERARALGPKTSFGREARTLLARLEAVGTK
jgi:tetratricopeptide (TPR) repeat protein